MAKQEGQKAKILCLLEILQTQSDEKHLLSVPQLLTLLAKAGIACERKSIYTDIAALQEAGYDIEVRRGPAGGYYMASRMFELPELKLLVDAVQSSRFITERKSQALIHKIGKLASTHQYTHLRRGVFVSGRAKSGNENAYYDVDRIYEAIDTNKTLVFDYTTYNLEKQKVTRRTGKQHEVSPWALAWEGNYYYLIAYQNYQEPFGLRHYRVDKLANVQITARDRDGAEQFAQFDLSAYMQRMFGMYSGAVANVTLRGENALIAAMIDRFGKNFIVIAEENGTHFHFDIPVAVSPQFFGWVCGFGGGVQITAPPEIRQQMAEFTANLASQYATE